MTKIVRFIRKRGSVPMKFLMDELEVSQASIKRDIEFLRDRLGCPLEWDRSKRGWVICDDLAEGGRFELPGVWFDSSEVFALLTMLHLVEGVQPGLLADHVGPLKTRLRSMLAEGTKSASPIERKLRLIHFAPRRVEPKHFQTIAGGLLQGKRLRLQYWNRERSEQTSRVISPQQLVHYRENWVLTPGATCVTSFESSRSRLFNRFTCWTKRLSRSARTRCRSISAVATASSLGKPCTEHA